MLLWRIEANALPTKENLQRRVPLNDSSCIHCQQMQESSAHLFLKCPITKAIWNSRCWGFKSDEHSITSNEGIIKLVLDPPKASCPMEDNCLISLDMAFVLDKIWRLRNQVLYKVASWILWLQSGTFFRNLTEHSSLMTNEKVPAPSSERCKWQTHTSGWIKVNVDAVVAESCSL